MSHRPTTLALYLDHCARAVRHYEERTPAEVDHFQAGIACHAVLQAVGEATNQRGAELGDQAAAKVAEAMARVLLRDGRSFEGHREPPMRPDHVWPGVRLALDFLAWAPLAPGGQYEIGAAVDASWRSVAYDSPEVYLRTILDRVQSYEEDGGVVFEVLDYKTSWATDADRLEHLQQKIQALLALPAAERAGADRLRRSVVNVRTGKVYTDELWIDGSTPDHEARAEEWRAEVKATMAALDDLAAKSYPARPGGGCFGCPYLGACAEANDYIDRAQTILGAGSDEQLALLYMVADAIKMDAAEKLKRRPAVAKGDGIEAGGWLLGWQVQPQRTPKPSAVGRVASEFALHGADAGVMRSALSAVGLTVGNIESAAKVLASTPKERESFLAETVETVSGRKRFIYQKAEGGEAP